MLFDMAYNQNPNFTMAAKCNLTIYIQLNNVDQCLFLSLEHLIYDYIFIKKKLKYSIFLFLILYVTVCQNLISFNAFK